MEVLSDLYRTGQKEHPDGERQGLDRPEGLNEEIDQGHHQNVAEAAAEERDPGEPGGDEDLQEEEDQGEAKVFASKGHQLIKPIGLLYATMPGEKNQAGRGREAPPFILSS